MNERIGTDTSVDAHTLSVVCSDCDEDAEGTPLYAGEEWGGYELPICECCGRQLCLTLVVPG